MKKLSQNGFRIENNESLNKLTHYDQLIDKVEPKERLFIESQEEKYLQLRKYLICDYKYKVS